MNINGLELPRTLQLGLEGGYWYSRFELLNMYSKNQSSAFSDALEDIFPMVERLDLGLYSFDAMASGTSAMINLDSRDHQFYYGKPSKRYPPGDIDPHLSIQIGEVESDSFLALDFRDGPEPRLIYMADIGFEPFWMTAKCTIDDLMEILADAHRKSG